MSGKFSFNPNVKRKGLAKWVDDRLPIMSFVDETLKYFPEPKNLNYLWNTGALLGITLVVMILSGIFLAQHYIPHEDLAFDSVERIVRDVNYGWLMRNIHAVGASMFFILVYTHMFRGIYYGSYKAPRELLWIIGVIIYLMMMATGFLGYVLPYGQMSFYGAKVITNFFDAFPFVGHYIKVWLIGGPEVNGDTLNRFFVFHYLLPFLIVAVVVIHIVALHAVGSNNPSGVNVKKKSDVIPFHPYYTAKDLFTLAILIFFWGKFVFFAPDFFGEPDNYIPANPMVTPESIVPEWYFLPFYAILKAVPSKLGGVVAMFSGVLVLLFLPWLDTSPVRSATYRPVYKWFFWLFFFNALMLGYVGKHHPEGWYLILSRVGTIYYFAFFLIVMPVLGYFEKPRPLPESISDDFAKKYNLK